MAIKYYLQPLLFNFNSIQFYLYSAKSQRKLSQGTYLFYFPLSPALNRQKSLSACGGLVEGHRASLGQDHNRSICFGEVQTNQLNFDAHPEAAPWSPFIGFQSSSKCDLEWCDWDESVCETVPWSSKCVYFSWHWYSVFLLLFCSQDNHHTKMSSYKMMTSGPKSGPLVMCTICFFS